VELARLGRNDGGSAPAAQVAGHVELDLDALGTDLDHGPEKVVFVLSDGVGDAEQSDACARAQPPGVRFEHRHARGREVEGEHDVVAAQGAALHAKGLAGFHEVAARDRDLALRGRPFEAHLTGAPELREVEGVGRADGHHADLVARRRDEEDRAVALDLAVEHVGWPRDRGQRARCRGANRRDPQAEGERGGQEPAQHAGQSR